MARRRNREDMSRVFSLPNSSWTRWYTALVPTMLVLLAVLLVWSPQATVNGRRTLRENAGRVASLTGQRWSSWYTAVVPGPIPRRNSRNYEQRSDGHEGFISRNIKKRFRGKQYDDGIYELRASRGRDHHVVYVGKSRSKSDDSLSQRIRDYWRDGSHLSDQINRVMKDGYKLSVRVKNIGPDEDVKKHEEKYLKKYDYAWNEKNNGGTRDNVPPP